MKEDTNDEELKCLDCKCDIDFGRDVITAQKGVNGPRGVVPLGELLIFCSEKCLSNYFNEHDGKKREQIPPRIP